MSEAVGEAVGFIGLGTMGGPMATNLARAGVSLLVHDAKPDATKPLSALPTVRVVGSAAEVAARSTVLFTCLPNDDVVRRVYLGDGGVGAGGRRGLVTCDCSTVSPETTLEVDRALAGRGITHMDTTMLGSQPQTVSGEIFFIVGGDPTKMETIAPCLKIMGKLHMHVGPSGSGNRVKLVHNGLVAVTAVAVAEALAIAVQSGVDPYVFYEGVRNGGGMAYRTDFERRGKRLPGGGVTP